MPRTAPGAAPLTLAPEPVTSPDEVSLRFYDVVSADGVDMAWGSRFLARTGFRTSFPRRVGIRLFSVVLSAFGVRASRSLVTMRIDPAVALAAPVN